MNHSPVSPSSVMCSPNSRSSPERARSKCCGAIRARSACSGSFNASAVDSIGTYHQQNRRSEPILEPGPEGFYDWLLASAQRDAARNTTALSAAVLVAARIRSVRRLLHDVTTPVGKTRAHLLRGLLGEQRFGVEAARGATHWAERVTAQTLQIDGVTRDPVTAVGKLIGIHARA